MHGPTCIVWANLTPLALLFADLGAKQQSAGYNFIAHGYTSNNLNPKQQHAYNRAHGLALDPKFAVSQHQNDHLP